MTSFIETQFPVSKVSKESYKERKGVQSQVLTGLGKWWGRKPLCLIRSVILGLLMPSSNDPHNDREIFMKILTMDEEGVWLRKKSSIPVKDVYTYTTRREREQWFSDESTENVLKYKKGISREQKLELQKLVFFRLSYDEKLKYCSRPDQVDGPSPGAWQEINAHLGTHASNIQDLVQELGERQFGHVPRVGDCFCGGGSVPFEAARIGCDAFGSDLNPVATLLTWAALNIIGGGEEVVEHVQNAQQDVYGAVGKQITEWDIERNEFGWRADVFFYCNEVVCPECGWRVPLAPSWLIGPTTKTIATLVPDRQKHIFEIGIESGVSAEAMKAAKMSGTIKNSRLVCSNPDCPAHVTPILISSIRGDGRGEGIRMWENDDIVPRPHDVFQERLCCIRWVETYTDDQGRKQTRKHYRAPDVSDLKREERVLALLRERFAEWQREGYIPSRTIESGYNTDQPIRERGWTHWHHMFNPRQLLIHGLLRENADKNSFDAVQKIAVLLGIGRCCNFNSKLCMWGEGAARESIAQTFSNQALNTLYFFPVRGFGLLYNIWMLNMNSSLIHNENKIFPIDARMVSEICDIWITDPSYADAINYHELSEYFLAWYGTSLLQLLPEWYADSKRALTIRGSDETFRKGMVESYRTLANHMPNNGAQIVMFTHQDAAVWADLALILWASGLQVTAAWCIATETNSGLKVGNYVQGTVLLVLRKQTSNDTAFLDEIYPRVEIEVKEQLDSMLALEDKEDPNFGDTDYQLAAYAAALRVITQYKEIEDIDVQRELFRVRQKNEKNPLEAVIDNAVKIACDYLVPNGIQRHIWKHLAPEERFYLKGLEIESHGEYRNGVYQELARGFGIREYRNMQASRKANQTRLKTASEFKNRKLGDEGFGSSLVRQILFAIYETVQNEDTSAGRVWLHTELGQQYWNRRQEIIELLKYLSSTSMTSSMEHWKEDADAARLLAGAIENDHV
jgi:adenine-specific DNA methylase